ncbi:MAG TPA: BatA domain-containing protein, partial [Gemmatimonadaceae bacterium]|nr:BatA domain-containing protein [Gemmatimonadaceae bacterium]
MTFLAPWVLVVAGAAAMAAVALHLIALARPPAAPFPTARFIPDTAARAASRTSRPTDRWLLLLRVVALLMLGAAFARPVRTPERAPLRQILLVDRSRAADVGAARDSALARLGPGDAVILFDTVAVSLDASGPDSLRARLGRAEATTAPARLSAALVAASRLATALRDSTDSVRVVVVSPLARESMDAATIAIRRRWPAALETVRTPLAAVDSARAAVTVRAPADDPLAIAVALSGAGGRSPVRVVRDHATGADSAWARDSAGLLLVWPDDAPDGWASRAVPDTMGAVVAAGARDDGATLVAPLLRVADAPAHGAVRARWVDGTPAAVESPLGAGCVRQVGVPLSGTGDLALGTSFARFVGAMLAPCGGERDAAPASDADVATLRGEGSSSHALGP